MKKLFFLLLLVFLYAIIVRFFYLGKVPISLEWDEVAIGYDAYSVLHTGRDQFGKWFPNTFRSLDDWKPPIYEYLTIPPIFLFGLNQFSVRFPSALIGSLSIVATYWLALTVFTRKKIALFSAFLLAVSPWHIQFSRAAFEVNISVFITILAVTCFIKGIKNQKYFLFSAFLFGLNLFSYHSSRILTPLLMVSLFILFNKSLPPKRIILKYILIFGLFLFFFIPLAVSPEAQIRFKATNIFNPGARYLDEKDLDKIFLEKRIGDGNAGFDLAGRIFHNSRLIYLDYDTVKKAAGKYFSHFSFDFLFINADVPLHHAPDFGLLHIWEFPLFVIGIMYFFMKRFNRYSAIIVLWMLYAPIPASVTREAPHAVRSLLILPTIQIFCALGLYVLSKKLLKESYWVVLLFIIFGAMTFSVNHSYYLHQYFVHTNYDLSNKWLYGREEAVLYTEKNKKNFDSVYVSLKLEMPHVFWLFYSKYPPEKYLKEGGTVSGGFADERNRFDKYEFRNFEYNNLPRDRKMLLVGKPADFPPDANILKKIYYLDGTPAIFIGTNKLI